MKTEKTTDKYGRPVEVILDLRHLKKLERLGLVEFTHQTGTKITGLHGGKSFTCAYIDGAGIFIHDGYKYRPEYFSGCFYPYLVREKLTADELESLNTK